jgi:hypothetical protein
MLEAAFMDHDEAARDFWQARRRATVEQILARLTGRSAHLLCYAEIADLLKHNAGRYLGCQEIALPAIAGSVGRCSDYTRAFLPLNDFDQERWTRARQAADRSKHLPPITVYQVGPLYFVLDGHHRISVARLRGLSHIQAHVVQIDSDIPQLAT